MNRFGIAVVFFIIFPLTSYTAELVGKRPYEMVNRTEDAHPPLVDFQSIDGWSVEAVETEAKFERTREQQLWGDYVARLTYKAIPHENQEERKPPRIFLKLPQPLNVPKPLDCVNFWVYGNNWAWESDTTTPRVSLALVFQGESDRTINVYLDTVRWKEWFLIHRKFTQSQLKELGETPKLLGIEITGGSNKDNRVLYFSNLSFYKEPLKPLKYEPRPKRNLELPIGQTVGTNTGPGKLPFPNREETILPSSFAKDYKNLCANNNEQYSFQYDGPDGKLVWNYVPKTGKLDDLSLSWTSYPNSSKKEYRFQNAGPTFAVKSETEPQLKSIQYDKEAQTLRAVWNFGEHHVEYDFKIQSKSLIVDFRCKGGSVTEIATGQIIGAKNPRLVQVPYLVGNGTSRPSVLIDGDTENPLFILPLFDHTRSNASELFFSNKIEADGVTLNTAARYKPKTDGKRNDCFERIFLNVSSRFEEVLPNIPNDESPWRHITAERVWRSHGSSNHDRDFDYWKKIHRYGVKKMLITDHEIMWRDGGESFTFRTSAAPGRGGDTGHKEYTKNIHSLGYIYGPYNNYTDYAPVNEYWNEDWVTRLPDGNFQPAWARCYNPKPAIAVQMEPKITEIIQEKFHFNTAYCDVHTAVTPWNYVDYDARVPGAGTFAATYYAYGEILLHQKKIWNGPVYSEGNNHWYYSGLTDGNYAQDQAYFVHQSNLPWLVDFDLLKIHPLENNFGMGYLNMFYGKSALSQMKGKGTALDRFLAATLAFGHTGFLAMETGYAGGIRSYFAVQQITARYGTKNVKSIRYADENGIFLDTTKALAANKVKLNRIRIEYEDGLILYVNGNMDLSWDCLDANETIAVIPPNGWFVRDTKNDNSAQKLQAWSLEHDGKRLDYVDAPNYLFAEVRNLSDDNSENETKTKTHRFPRILCDGQLIVLKNVDEQGRWEMIVGEPNYSARSTIHAVELDGQLDAKVVALDFERKEIAQAQTRYSRGMVHVLPVEGAFSYLLTPQPRSSSMVSIDSKQIRIVPGQKVSVTEKSGNTTHTVSHSIPQDAKPGTLLFIDDNRIDFDVVPLCEITAKLDTKNQKIEFQIFSNLEYENKFEVRCTPENRVQSVVLKPKQKTPISWNVNFPDKPMVVPLEFEFSSILADTSDQKSSVSRKYWLKSDLGFFEGEQFSEHFDSGYCLRNKKPTPFDGNSGAYAHLETVSCGDTQRRSWAIHPPYIGGVGYTFMLSEPIIVPDEPGITFTSEVGIRNGGDASDGVLYRVFVVEQNSNPKETLVGEINWKERSWTPLVCDLEPWRGKTVRLRLIADVGPNDHSGADWACWSHLQLRSNNLKLFHSLHEKPVDLTFVIPEKPMLSGTDFAKAEKLELVFEGCGMESSDRYHTNATLNGVPLGRLPGAGGDENRGIWVPCAVSLSPEAIKTLKQTNQLEIQPFEDSFKIRRFRIIATLNDGIKRSTLITNRTLTHPPGWKHAEGEIVLKNTPITIELITSFSPSE